MDEYKNAITSALVSAITSLIVAFFTSRSQQRKSIDERILKLIEIGMKHPHLEDDEYCSNWKGINEHQNDEEKKIAIQYELYRCFVFNLIEAVWEHCIFSRSIKKILHVDELIESHQVWWDKQICNIHGYSPRFRTFVKLKIDEFRLNGRSK